MFLRLQQNSETFFATTQACEADLDISQFEITPYHNHQQRTNGQI
jgi:hypothetical protein